MFPNLGKSINAFMLRKNTSHAKKFWVRKQFSPEHY